MNRGANRPVALVSGASQGIGAAAAVALARAGYDLALTSTQPEKLAGVRTEAEAAGARVVTAALELRSQASIERAFAALLAGCGRIDLLVNNAGVPLKAAALEVTREQWDDCASVNLAGTFFMCQQMGRHLVDAGRAGCIINVASTHGLVGLAGRTVYGTLKGGVIQMTRALAVEWAPHGIRVNAVAPGRVDTAARAGSFADPGYLASSLARIPLGRLASAAEVADAICYLASDAAAYVTGQTLVLDGGLTAQ